MAKALWYIPSGRKFSMFWQWANRVDFVDKLILSNYLTHEAHKIARKFFLENDYDYFIMGHDDYLGSPDYVRQLLRDEKKHNFPVISGWSNIYLFKDLASITIRKPRGIEKGKVGMKDYPFVSMSDLIQAKYGYPFVRVWFIGFPLTLIRRDVFEKVPFRGFKTMKDGFCNTPKTKKLGRPIVFDLAFAVDCAKKKIPIHIDTRVFLMHFGKRGMYQYLRMGKDKKKTKFVKAKRK